MSRRTATLSLVVLCALVPGVLAAAEALAGTTAFTCVVGGGTANTNADCAPGSTGKSGHKEIAPAKSTSLTLESHSKWIFVSDLIGTSLELDATGAECVECTAENKEVGGVMEVTGSGGRLRFTGVTVVGWACTVVGSATETITSEELKFTTTSVTGATLEPTSGSVLAKFDLTGAKCPIKNAEIGILGKVPATVNGATLTINVTKASGALTLEGEKASLKGEGTLEANSEVAVALTAA